MTKLVKFKHSADKFYKKFELEYKDRGIDFFSCYENNQKNCVNCETIFKSTFNMIMSKIDINPEWTFMDCGCGLGYPLYLASDKFKKVYGVEIMTEIADIANSNLKKLKIENFEIINSDIRLVDKEIIKEIDVFYLFNPFRDDILVQFTDKLADIIATNKKEVWVIYAYAVHEDLMKKYSDILPLEISIEDFGKINFYHHKP